MSGLRRMRGAECARAWERALGGARGRAGARLAGGALALVLSLLLSICVASRARAQTPAAESAGEPALAAAPERSDDAIARPREEDYWRLVTLPVPEGVALEVGGIAMLADGRAMVCTRRGEVWTIEHPLAEDPSEIRYQLYCEGLQEPLGLLVQGEWVYVVQRGELSRMRDADGDGAMDELETVCDAWRVGGNYHEYNFGPALDRDGNFWITTNRPFGDNPFGDQPWRGFALRITPDGRMLPTCAGLRSPAGVATSPWGDVFYTDNQGEWCGASKLAHLVPGSFHGHPWGIESCRRAEWPYGFPGEPKSGAPMPEVSASLPSFQLPAVWFPYDKMGKSPAGLVWDETGGKFGPFEGQVFVGDQHHASVMRVFLERVNGRWQGACFPFREGLQCGVVRLAWGEDGSLFCGETNRGWGGRGTRTEGLERLVWTGRVPFEVWSVEVLARGFRVRFTREVDAGSVEAWRLREGGATGADGSANERGSAPGARVASYTYLHHEEYGSPETDRRDLAVGEVVVSEDRRSVELEVELRAGYVHELHFDELRSSEGERLLHPEAYYTVVEIPR